MEIIVDKLDPKQFAAAIMSWQPIDTAPEKTPVLAVWADQYGAQYHVSEKWSVDEDGEGFALGWVDAYEGCEPYAVPPDWWMPLLEAPNAGVAGLAPAQETTK